eukprot:CAMPEP_0170081816 /NCGR_PEP_ID=MMETSP0019_2-20121128/17586_1 /TAXON_ID=98059 /ORGANISM="Dinobryon sp., Strain UTEXLB2267" /LENGTH=59 /DNA_ID=CAMNT_0010296429 /DNA_START=27 /DNA_END=203 /DNA_ORIENTATION=+
MSNLAGLYKYQGRYDEAEPLDKDCHDMLRTVLGERQDMYGETKPLYKDCFEIQRAVLGE